MVLNKILQLTSSITSANKAVSLELRSAKTFKAYGKHLLFQTVARSMSGYKKKFIAISVEVEIHLVVFLPVLDMRNGERI